MGDIPDSELVMSSQAGSKDAFTALFHRYKARILNYLCGYLGDFHAAQDIAQDAFINAYKNISALKDPKLFSSWIFTIATNLSKNHLLKVGRVKQVSIDASFEDACEGDLKDVIPGPGPRPDEELDKRILNNKIKGVLVSLPTIYREVLLLCDVEGMSYEDAAAILNCKVGTVGSRLSEARRLFRDIFNKKKGDDI